MGRQWHVDVATDHDLERWLEFVESVQDEFHGLDLANDPSHRAAVAKNIGRGTAVFVRSPADDAIVGAMIYSPRSRHIGWLAVGRRYRRLGIGTALVRYALEQLGATDPVDVRTFLMSDPPGPTAHEFYRSLGFRPVGIEDDTDGRNAGKPFVLFAWSPS
jgi:ribosomal protein S18 acetylase RimI-like enzyme